VLLLGVRYTLILLLFSCAAWGQDTTVTWINNIDTNSFKLLYDKKEIPKEFYLILQMRTIKDIASANEPFQGGCTGGGKGWPSQHLNWLAVDKNNHWVLSVSHGGRGYWTDYYYFDKEKGQLNVNILMFKGNIGDSGFTFEQTIPKLKARQFYRNEVFIPSFSFVDSYGNKIEIDNNCKIPKKLDTTFFKLNLNGKLLSGTEKKFHYAVVDIKSKGRGKKYELMVMQIPQ